MEQVQVSKEHALVLACVTAKAVASMPSRLRPSGPRASKCLDDELSRDDLLNYIW